MGCAFLWDERVSASGSITALAGDEVVTMPLSNLVDPQPRLRARLLGASATLQVDFGDAVALDALALISTTLPAGATIRWRVGTSDAMGSGDTAYDSDTVDAGLSDECGGTIVMLAPSTVTGRYLRVDLAASGAVTIDIGRLVAGPLWRPARSFGYGIVEGRQINDRRDTNPLTGASFAVPALANPRGTKFTLPLLTTAEARGQHRSLVRVLGGAADALWIPDTTVSQAELNARALWGATAAPGDLAATSRDNFVGSSRSFTITERV